MSEDDTNPEYRATKFEKAYYILMEYHKYLPEWAKKESGKRLDGVGL